MKGYLRLDNDAFGDFLYGPAWTDPNVHADILSRFPSDTEDRWAETAISPGDFGYFDQLVRPVVDAAPLISSFNLIARLKLSTPWPAGVALDLFCSGGPHTVRTIDDDTTWLDFASELWTINPLTNLPWTIANLATTLFSITFPCDNVGVQFTHAIVEVEFDAPGAIYSNFKPSTTLLANKPFYIILDTSKDMYNADSVVIKYQTDYSTGSIAAWPYDQNRIIALVPAASNTLASRWTIRPMATFGTTKYHDRKFTMVIS